MEEKKETEALYIKILIIATALMMAFVCTVFIIANVSGNRADAPATTADTGEPSAPVVVTKNYLARYSEKTAKFQKSKLDADYAILVDADELTAIAALDADKRIYPASMTKIMTILVACENVGDLDETVQVSAEVVAAAYIAGASCAGFSIGERVTVRDLLYGAALPSGADATGMLARYVAGTESKFVGMMNQKAAELGLHETHFANVSGLHNSNHYSTVREIAAIMTCAMENELCRTLLGASTYTTTKTSEHPDGITLYSTSFSRMQTTTFGNATVVAAKTGYTDEAKYCLASYAESSDGKHYVLVTAHGSDKYKPGDDCKYAYGAYIK